MASDFAGADFRKILGRSRRAKRRMKNRSASDKPLQDYRELRFGRQFVECEIIEPYILGIPCQKPGF